MSRADVAQSSGDLSAGTTDSGLAGEVPLWVSAERATCIADSAFARLSVPERSGCNYQPPPTPNSTSATVLHARHYRLGLLQWEMYVSVTLVPYHLCTRVV